MRKWSSLIVGVIAAGLPLLSAGTSAAQTLSVTREITITARVLPMHTIILDARGNIDQIISNTTENVKTPEVYMQKVSKDAKQALTPEVYKEYVSLVGHSKSRVGTLYKQSPLATIKAMRSSPNNKAKTNSWSYALTGSGLVTHQSSLVSESRI